MKYIDLRSDTVTRPTPEMRQAMFDAVVGDDVYEDDPTVKQLEELAASITGKEASLFVPTGTMGNQLSIMTHTNRGDEIITGAHSHIVHHEAGAPALLSGVNFALVNNPDNIIYASDVKRLVRPYDIHFPRTSLLCLENALSDGRVVPVNIMRETYMAAKEYGVPTHLDGARLFNAAVSLDVDVKEITSCCDTVMFCVSKGLCAPVGSLLCGSSDFIGKARRNRKILGGGMRQAGVLAACGIVSLEKMVSRLYIDHDNAKYFANCLNKIDYIDCDISRVQINMVFFKVNLPYFDPANFVTYMLSNGVKINGLLDGEFRMVTNNDVSRQDIDYVVGLLSKLRDILH